MRLLSILLAALLAAGAAPAEDWSSFNGNLQAQKFAPDTEITPENVKDLQVAWSVHTGDVSTGDGDVPQSAWSATPIFANDTLYLGTPFYRILALDPGTGATKWSFDTKSALAALTQPELKNRGVAYWQAADPTPGAPCQKRVIMGTMDAHLFEVDADTGQPCADFAKDGVLDINDFNQTNAKWPLSLLQPPTVAGDTMFLGWAGKDWEEQVDSPGTIFALDVRTGAVKWTFASLPADIHGLTGTANVWASMSVDPDRHLLYIPVSSPSPNFYQGAVPADLPIVTSVTALDTETGAVRWSRQLVHHDVWDLDTNSAPTLVDLPKDGQTVPALVQTSKQGFLYVLNRETGEPIFPIEERPVPQSDVPGEHTAPTQPYVALPERVIPDRWPGIFDLADRLSFGYCSKTLKALRYDGSFTPRASRAAWSIPAPSAASNGAAARSIRRAASSSSTIRARSRSTS